MTKALWIEMQLWSPGDQQILTLNVSLGTPLHTQKSWFKKSEVQFPVSHCVSCIWFLVNFLFYAASD